MGAPEIVTLNAALIRALGTKRILLFASLLVIFELYLNFADAALGTSVEVPTIDGRVKIKIPAGTQSGKIFRLKGKGLPVVQSYQQGDQLIHVSVWTPKKLSAEDKAILEKMRGLENFKPHPGKSDKGFFEKMKDHDNFMPRPSNSEKSFFEKVKDMFS